MRLWLPRGGAPALVCSVVFVLGPAEGVGAEARRISFPDVPGYRTLVGDFHEHTVFSDGDVWPNLRVQEAVREGLDAIAITDHLEYQPHQADLPNADRNRSGQIAREAAAQTELIVVAGAEVTRDQPLGHANALFLQDANRLRCDDPADALREAARQGAFVMWNHPSWVQQTPDGVARLTALHEQLFKEGLIQGIEVVNEHEFSDEALQIALDRGLTIMGNSDIHGLAEWAYREEDFGHRPVTLVFATAKTEAAIKDALLHQRTVVWFKNTLIGREEWLGALLRASLTAAAPGYREKTVVWDLALTNASDADFVLRNVSAYRLHDSADVLTVKAHRTVKVGVKTLQPLARVEVAFEVMNAITAPGVHPTVRFALDVPAAGAAP